jgi:hypothetical protein
MDEKLGMALEQGIGKEFQVVIKTTEKGGKTYYNLTSATLFESDTTDSPPETDSKAPENPATKNSPQTLSLSPKDLLSARQTALGRAVESAGYLIETAKMIGEPLSYDDFQNYRKKFMDQYLKDLGV